MDVSEIIAKIKYLGGCTFYNLDYSEYGSLENCDEDEDPNVFSIDLCVNTGDYGNNGMVRVSNYKTLQEILNENKIKYTEKIYMYGACGLLIDIEDLVSENETENETEKREEIECKFSQVVEVIDGVNDYCVLDDELMRELESEVFSEYVGEFIKSSLVSDVKKHLRGEIERYQEMVDNSDAPQDWTINNLEALKVKQSHIDSTSELVKNFIESLEENTEKHNDIVNLLNCDSGWFVEQLSLLCFQESEIIDDCWDKIVEMAREG